MVKGQRVYTTYPWYAWHVGLVATVVEVRDNGLSVIRLPEHGSMTYPTELLRPA